MVEKITKWVCKLFHYNIYSVQFQLDLQIYSYLSLVGQKMLVVLEVMQSFFEAVVLWKRFQTLPLSATFVIPGRKQSKLKLPTFRKNITQQKQATNIQRKKEV